MIGCKTSGFICSLRKPEWCSEALWELWKVLQLTCTSSYFEGKKRTVLYLSQGMPVRNGLAWVGQHLVPVVPPQALSIWPRPTHTYHLVVAHPVGIMQTHTHTHKHAISWVHKIYMTPKSWVLVWWNNSDPRFGNYSELCGSWAFWKVVMIILCSDACRIWVKSSVDEVHLSSSSPQS